MKIKKFNTYEDYWKNQALLETESKEMVGAHDRLSYTLNLFYEFIKKGDVLDVGCRDGWSTEQLKKKGFGSVGIDLSPLMVKHAKKMGRNVYEMDMETIAFKDNEFDGIFCVHSLEHSRDAGKVLKEFYRITKNNGIICLEVPKQTVENYKHISCWESLEEFERYILDNIKVEIIKSFYSPFAGSQGHNMIIIGRVMK